MMLSGLTVIMHLLDELKSEVKPYKIKVSKQCLGMYKKEKSFFWRAVILEDYSYRGEGMMLKATVSVVPPEFDNIRFRITNPDEEIKYTDVVRANRGFAFYEIAEKKFLYLHSESSNNQEVLKNLAIEILDSVRHDVAEFTEKIQSEYGDLFRYHISQQKNEPILAGLAYIHYGDYLLAKECFDLAEVDGNYWSMCYGTLERYFHRVCRDYCIAMIRGIPWVRGYVNNPPDFATEL